MPNSNASWTSNDSGITLHFRRRATNGRLIGPAQAGAFGIDAPESVTVTRIDDHQDGSYDILLSGATPATEIEWTLFGDAIYAGPITGLCGECGASTLCERITQALSIPCWVFWLIVGLIVLVVVAIVIRKTNS